ncbi:hypothetical protein NUU61_002652 [Penicillium alfredii]|uniref:Transcription factor domain-containing protein n=1 Tax=Penicillium alfredii TaxID=1506179 RepID=A0A9W9FSN1_9EURO|nr:uncharacterized protein NUU61_002652 [Penicillium alfredii]KAJ5105305.1 hypothetical protein NUU61_002652 [Penicillium alfredii]
MLATEPTLDLEISPSFELTVPRAAPPKSLSGIIASRLQFAIDLIKDAPRMMVAENQTPWCHRQLYKNGMPRVMQDAYTCCSLHLNKNEMNAPVVMSILESRTRDLLSSPIPTSPLDILARTQAIILYKIMHLFDGNTRSHFAIESLSAALDSSAMSLHGYLHFPDPSHPTQLFPTSMEPIMNFWDTWIFQESAWRTVLLTLYFHQVYNVLQGRIPTVCDGKLGLTHAWYLSAHLWNSQSAFDFAIAWMEKPHFVVYDADFSSVLCDAQPSDVDVFGRMWLVTLLGIDEAKAWFYSRGALL